MFRSPATARNVPLTAPLPDQCDHRLFNVVSFGVLSVGGQPIPVSDVAHALALAALVAHGTGVAYKVSFVL